VSQLKPQTSHTPDMKAAPWPRRKDFQCDALLSEEGDQNPSCLCEAMVKLNFPHAHQPLN
jgi:hypothetical protein